MGTISAISTLADISSYWAESTPNKTAIIAGAREWTFAEVDREAAQVAAGLIEEGVGTGDRVAFLDKNVPEYFPILFGGAKLNAVSVAVNWRLAPAEMEFIVNNAEVKVLFVGEEFLPSLALMTITPIPTIVIIGSPGSSGYLAYDEWIDAAQPAPIETVVESDDTCYQLYTSGTTGLPKGVELTNRNLITCMKIGGKNWSFHEGAVNLVAMPLFHIAGSGWGLAGMYSGAQTVLTREVDPVEIIKLIPELGITHALLVPAVLQFLLAVPSAADADLSSMEVMVYGASPISERVLVGSMELFGCKFIQAYGLTETTGGVAQLDSQDHDPSGGRSNLLRSAGRPWGDVELKIVDATTLDEVADGEVGEIWVRSIQVMKGYWRDPEATAAAVTDDGFFRTGDAGYLKEGYLFIHDRVKDMIVSGGENIYPAEIENALMKHPAVADVAVIGVPHEIWGETVKAIVVRAEEALDQQTLGQFAKQHLAGYKCPTSVDWVEELPRNPSGKILKTELRAPYWEGRDRLVN